MRERWPIPKALRKPLIERLAEVVQDTACTPREVTSAAKAILSASKINLETITATIKAHEHEELVQRLTELEARVEADRARDNQRF
jgi:DNA polymerase II large subunit